MLRPASSVVLMVEKLAYPREYKMPDQSVGQEALHMSPQGYTNNIGQLKANWKRFTTRHRRGGMLLFADGHVAWFSWAQLQPPINIQNPALVDGNQPDLGVIWNPLGGVGMKISASQ